MHFRCFIYTYKKVLYMTVCVCYLGRYIILSFFHRSEAIWPIIKLNCHNKQLSTKNFTD